MGAAPPGPPDFLLIGSVLLLLSTAPAGPAAPAPATPESVEPPPEPPPPPDPPPCEFNSMCSCNGGEVSCVGVPLHRLPALPRRPLHHVEVLHSALSALDDGALAGVRTTTLRLIGNRIIHVAPHALAPLASELRSLDLSYNQLQRVPEALQPLLNLNWLSLHGNQVSSLDVDWARMRDTLTNLYLGENDLTALPERSQQPSANDVLASESKDSGGEGSLAQLTRLQTLEVDNNHLTSLSASSLPASLRSLSAQNNALVRVPSGLLEPLEPLEPGLPVGLPTGLPRLQHLLLRGNLIRTLPRAGLRALRSLERLDLADNNIQSLPPNCFNGTLAVRDLRLDHNSLRALPARALSGFRSSRLSLASNRLERLDRDAFQGLEDSLEHLDLDSNALTEWPTAALAGLSRLRALLVANNRLREVGAGALRGCGGSLRALSLSGNELRALPVAALRTCTQLAHLNAGYNGISQLQQGDLAGWAQHLDSLQLASNHIAHLGPRTFRHAPHLRELNLSFNRLASVDRDAFQDLAELQSLEVSFSLAAMDRFPEEALRPLSALRWLALDNNDIRALSSTALRPLSSLEFLNLEDNLLSALPPGLLDGAAHPRLRELRLGYNSLRAVRAAAFQGLPSLRTLLLAGNHIQVVESDALRDLPRLETLILSDNRVSKLQPRAFRDLPALSSLDLHRNQLRLLSLSAFLNVSRPEAPLSLNVSWNRVAELYSGDLEGAPLYVQSLDLGHNLVAELQSKFLLGVSAALRRLYLRHNRVSRLDSGVLGVLQALETLELAHNDLVTLMPRAFQGCDLLQVLDLSHNHIAALHVEQFAGLENLRVLDLSHNRLAAVPGEALARTRLERLDLSHNDLPGVPSAALAEVTASLRALSLAGNAIQHLDGTVFLAAAALRHLDLSDNKLASLPDNVLSPLSGLLSLRLGRNPLRANGANLAELLHYVHGLRELSLDGMGLRAAPPLPLPSLVALNVSANALSSLPALPALPALRRMDATANRLRAPPAGPYPLLRDLDVSNNPIRTLGRESFAEMPRLQTLVMRSLPLEAVEVDTLQPLRLLSTLQADAWTNLGPQRLGQVLAAAPMIKVLSLVVAASSDPLPGHVLAGALRPSVRRLELTGPGLTALGPHSLGGGLPDYRRFTLQVSGTPLAEFPAALFARLAHIPHLSLDFRENRLTSLAPETFYRNSSSWERAGTTLISGGINLKGNPWICDCSLSWLGAWLRRWLREVLQVHALEAGAAARVREAAQGAACAARGPSPVGPAAPGPPLLRLRATGCSASALSASASRTTPPPGLLAALGLVLALLPPS